MDLNRQLRLSDRLKITRHNETFVHKNMNYRFQPVTRDSWSDLEGLFESRGGPHYCWCTAWRTLDKRKAKPDKAAKKAVMHQQVHEGMAVGILAYADEEAVAWCSIAARESYKNLGGSETKGTVWSLVCFYVKKAYRKQGLTKLLLDEAIAYARRNGADYIEAYPVDTSSPSYRFMGLRPMFEQANFSFVKMAGTRRNVMLLALK